MRSFFDQTFHMPAREGLFVMRLFFAFLSLSLSRSHSFPLTFCWCDADILQTTYNLCDGYRPYTQLQSLLIRLNSLLHPYRSFSALTSASTYVLLFGLLFCYWQWLWWQR